MFRTFNLATLPILVGLTVTGSAFGVWLGNSAISQINPAYFTERETRFHADATPYRSPDWAQVQAAEQADLAEGLGSGCVGCRTWPEEYSPTAEREESWTSGAVPASVEAQPAAMVLADDPELTRIERYAAYPVSDQEAQAQAEAEAPLEAEDSLSQ